MIRIVHTADWHLGQELAGHSRLAEQRRVLAALADLVVRREADVLLVAGDIFDSPNPTAEAQALLYGFLDRVSRELPHLTTVLVAGNHDSAVRLEAPGPVLGWRRVHAVGAVHRQDGGLDLDRHLVAIAARDGGPDVHVLAVPYLRPADLDWARGEDPEATDAASAAVARLYGGLVAAARARLGEAPLVATGHLTVGGAALSASQSERGLIVGGEEGVSREAFGPELAYVALGHLHRAQSLGGGAGPVVRYAGSLLPLSAAERTYRHGVTVVEIDAGGLRLEHVELPRPVAFLRVPETGHLPVGAIEEALRAAGLAGATEAGVAEEGWPFVELAIAVEGAPGTLRADLDRLLATFALKALAPDIRGPAGPSAGPAPVPLRRLAELDPGELFRAAFERSHGTPPGEDHLRAFREALEEARA